MPTFCSTPLHPPLLSNSARNSSLPFSRHLIRMPAIVKVRLRKREGGKEKERWSQRPQGEKRRITMCLVQWETGAVTGRPPWQVVAFAFTWKHKQTLIREVALPGNASMRPITTDITGSERSRQTGGQQRRRQPSCFIIIWPASEVKLHSVDRNL